MVVFDETSDPNYHIMWNVSACNKPVCLFSSLLAFHSKATSLYVVMVKSYNCITSLCKEVCCTPMSCQETPQSVWDLARGRWKRAEPGQSRGQMKAMKGAVPHLIPYPLPGFNSPFWELNQQKSWCRSR